MRGEWTQEQKDFLFKHYETLTNNAIARYLGKDNRTISMYAHRAGLRKKKQGCPPAPDGTIHSRPGRDGRKRYTMKYNGTWVPALQVIYEMEYGPQEAGVFYRVIDERLPLTAQNLQKVVRSSLIVNACPIRKVNAYKEAIKKKKEKAKRKQLLADLGINFSRNVQGRAASSSPPSKVRAIHTAPKEYDLVA